MEMIVQMIVKVILSILALPIPFIVGDSTTYEATEYAGYGSGHPGHGFTIGAIGFVNDIPIMDESVVNPLFVPDGDYEGPVVIAVSLWDQFSEDLTGYVEAVDFYRELGYNVIVVKVPEINNDLVVLNNKVESLLGCDLVDHRYRDVELQDEVHPTPLGGRHLAHQLALLGEEYYCDYE